MLSEILSSKIMLILVTLLGMALCTAGIGKVAAMGQWLQPFAIVGYVLGALVLVIAGATLLGISLPVIDSPGTALMAVVVLGIVKFLLTQLHWSLA